MKPKRPSDYPWPVTAHHASFIEDFNNAMDSRPITPTTASDSTAPTATARTDAAVIASGFQAVPFGFQDFARQLETELAAAKAECERLRADGAASAFVDMSVRASRAETELARLRAEVERLKGALALGQENCDAIYNDMREERTELYARAERAEAEVERLKELLRIESSSAQHALAWAERAEADTARLDWLLDHGAQTHHSNPRAGGNYVQYHKDRAAIDAAMKP